MSLTSIFCHSTPVSTACLSHRLPAEIPALSRCLHPVSTNMVDFRFPHKRFAGNGLREAGFKSFEDVEPALVAELDAGILDDFCPFGRFFPDDRGKLGRRVADRFEAKFVE